MSGTNGTPPRDKVGPLPGTKWDPSLGQTGLSLFNSTVKSPFCPVCPWDGWGFVPGTIVPQGPSEKCLCVFCLLFFFCFQNCCDQSQGCEGICYNLQSAAPKLQTRLLLFRFLSGNKKMTDIEPSSNVFRQFRLRVSSQYGKVLNYRHPVWRLEVVLGIVC